MLESRDQAMSAGENKATKQRHLPTGEQRPGNFSRGKTEQQSRGTHRLNSRGQAISAG